MKRSDLNSEQQKKYCWNFGHLFANEEAWKTALSQIDQNVNDIAVFQDQIQNLQVFKKYLQANHKISLLSAKLGQYLHYGDIDQTNLQYKTLNSLYQNKATEWAPKLAWISPALKKIGQLQINQWIKENEDLQVYQHEMDVFFQNDKYILSEHDEKLLSKVSRSRGAVDSLYDALVYADKTLAMIDYQKKQQELTQTLYLDILENSDPIADQKFRITTYQKFHADIISKKHTLAEIYEAIINYEKEEVNIRFNDQKSANDKQLTPIVYSLESDKVPLSVYQNLIKIGQKYSYLVSEFYQIKKTFFKLEKFYVTDTSLKLAQMPAKKYDVEAGIKIVKQALAVLGPEYLAQLEIALQPGKIDYFEDTNKRTGAYSAGGAGVEPIILMNWDDTINAINTLGHELGHSVHTLFADQYQKYPNNSYPIILAEVASTVNEHLIFDYLYADAKDDQTKIYLLQSHIETIIGTFFRQIQFAEFEAKAHELVVQGQPINADILADLFHSISNKHGQKTLDEIDRNQKPYSWPRVLHFFHSPFYVYKYATSIAVSYKLYQDIKQQHPEHLLNFLKAGGSDYPLTILKNAGVDLNKPEVYQPLIAKLESFISDLKQLLQKKG